MQRGRNWMYATAGVQMGPGIEMNVRSHVYIPDAEAGSEQVRSHYQAGTMPQQKKELKLTRNAAAMLLLVLAVILTIFMGTKALEYARLSGKYRDTVTRIESVNTANQNSAQALAEARDINRIRYLATTEYGMVSVKSVETIPVTAPATRAAESYTNGQPANSPFAGGQGIISGSR